MSKLIVLCGISGSGKSTLARQLIQSGEADVRVCRDNVREMLFGYSEENVGEYYGRKDLGACEKKVTDFVKSVVLRYLDEGKTVIIDQTNLKVKYLNEWKKYDVPVDFRMVDVDIDLAIDRDSKRVRKVGKDIIKRQFAEFNQVKKNFPKDFKPEPEVEPYVEDGNLPRCIIVDMDGTLAYMKGRSPYEWDRVDEDGVNEHVKTIVNNYSNTFTGHSRNRVFVFSARDGAAYDKTDQWLYDNGIMADNLVLRPEKDMRRDWIVKLEMFNKHIRGKYDLDFWLDDRCQILRFLKNKLKVPVLSNNPLGIEY